MKPSNASIIEAANSALMVKGELDAIPEFFSSDYVAHLTGEDVTGGHSLVRRAIETYLRAFSDRQIEVVVLVEAESRIAWQRTIRATHRATFKGFPATNRSIMWRDLIVSELREGLICEEWLTSDLAEQLLAHRKK